MDFRRLFDILPYQLARYEQKIALAHKSNGQWQTFSTVEVIEISQKLSAGFLDLGIKKGNTVGIMTCAGSPIWNFLDLALMQIGAVLVPIHATVNNEKLIFILKDAEIKFCFVENADFYEKLKLAKPNSLHLKEVYCLENLPDIPYWKDLLVAPNDDHLADLQIFKGVIHEEDLATIIYTSGTTGVPKGVRLTHKNIVSNIKAVLPIVPVNCDKRVLSFLPMSHIFERMTCFLYMASGASIYYESDIEKSVETMQKVRPHFFTAVPRLIEKLYDGILKNANERSGISRKLIFWAIRLGENYKGDKNVGLFYWIKLMIADSFVFRKWRKILGGRVEGMVVGAAHLQPRLARLFNAAGIAIREGYGLTEASPVVAFNHFDPGLFRFNTVGLPIPGTEVKIHEPNEDGAGEIWVKGPGIMEGYHNQSEETKKVKTEDGWLKTGDVGKFVERRFLQITDRKKDIFKTSSGKYIAPQAIENQLLNSPYIEQCMIIGFQKPYLIALIVPSFPMLQKWCLENKVHWTAPQFMAINPKVEKFMKTVVDEMNVGLANHEKVQEIILLYEEWTPKNGLVSYNMKVLRPVVLTRFSKEIEQIFG